MVQNFREKRTSPPAICAGIYRPVKAYNFVAEGFHTKKLCSRLSSSKVHFYTENDKLVAFEAPLGIGATYAVHLRLIGKLVADFPLVIIELFFARCNC